LVRGHGHGANGKAKPDGEKENGAGKKFRLQGVKFAVNSEVRFPPTAAPP
jgi:hypothetical protein